VVSCWTIGGIWVVNAWCFAACFVVVEATPTFETNFRELV
jgi:hypothetical protein